MHFYCLVILPKDVMPSEEAVAELMRPGSSYLEVEEHEEDCWNCGGTGSYVNSEGNDVDCDDCEGTGVICSTHNDNAWWDWYVIGGRWNGVLTGTESTKDTYTNDLENNACRVADIVLTPERYPYTIITPHGDKYANEDEKYHDKPGWKDEARAVLWRFAEHYCVAVDYHM